MKRSQLKQLIKEEIKKIDEWVKQNPPPRYSINTLDYTKELKSYGDLNRFYYNLFRELKFDKKIQDNALFDEDMNIKTFNMTSTHDGIGWFVIPMPNDKNGFEAKYQIGKKTNQDIIGVPINKQKVNIEFLLPHQQKMLQNLDVVLQLKTNPNIKRHEKLEYFS